jgi:hypothetical protein
MNNLALSYTALNRPADALKLNEEMLAIQKRVLPKDHPDTLKEMWNLADSLSQLGRGGEAIPIIDECFAKAAGQEVHPGMIPNLIMLRMDHFEKVGDAAGCRATAAKWEKLNRPTPRACTMPAASGASPPRFRPRLRELTPPGSPRKTPTGRWRG